MGVSTALEHQWPILSSWQGLERHRTLTSSHVRVGFPHWVKWDGEINPTCRLHHSTDRDPSLKTRGSRPSKDNCSLLPAAAAVWPDTHSPPVMPSPIMHCSLKTASWENPFLCHLCFITSSQHTVARNSFKGRRGLRKERSICILQVRFYFQHSGSWGRRISLSWWPVWSRKKPDPSK